MTYWADRYETNPIHDIERQECRDARDHNPSTGTCVRHDWAHGHNQLVCVNCDTTITEGDT